MSGPEQRGSRSLQQQLAAAGDDYDTLCRLIVAFQINTGARFPRTAQDAVSAIRQHIDNTARSFYDVRERMVKRSKGMIDSLRKCRKHQLRCQEFYDAAASEVGQLNQLTTCQLNIYRPRFIELIKERSARLKGGRHKILILGEICAGKSSILNHLMGGLYFPVGHGHCTRIPCEVRNDSLRRAYLYYEEEQWSEPAFSFDLSKDPEDVSWIRIQRCIVNGYDQMNEDKTYYSRPLHKIVISWPLEMFQNQQGNQHRIDWNSEETHVLKLPQTNKSEPKLECKDPEVPYNGETEVLKSTKSEPTLQYRGLTFAAGITRPKGPVDVETVYSRDDTANKPASSEDFQQSSLSRSSDEYDDTLKLINGITFVDAPGIHDTDESFLSLQPHIQDSDAFIFVISNAEHDGVAKDRILKLMELVRQTYEEKNNHFNPQCALFLCNKWDILEEEYKEVLLDTILKKLRECWPTIVRKQLYPISGSKQILCQIRNGKIPKLYEEFYYGMCSFIEKATSINIESNCWWLTSFLDKIVALQKNAKNILAFARQQKNEVLTCLLELKKAMIDASDNHKDTLQRITEEEEKAVNAVQNRIKYVLKTNKKLLCNWSDSDLPPRDNDVPWRNYQYDLNKQIAKRLENILVNDDETDLILDTFERNIKQELVKMKTLISEEDSKASFLQPLTASVDLANDNDGVMSNSKFPFIVLAVVFTLPVAPFILILWHLFEEATVPVLQDDELRFTQNPNEYMMKQTNIFIEKVLKEKLLNVAHARLESLSSNAKHMMQFFSACVEDRLSCINEMTRQVVGETVSSDNHTKLNEITKDLSQFYVTEIMKHEINFDELRTDTENPANLIGEGGPCSYVVKGEYFDEQSNNVAVKVIKWPRGEEESIFRECFILRQLSQKAEEEKTNFVKFYGSTYTVRGHTFKLMLVCELCDTDLAKMVQMDRMILSTGTEVDFPGKDPLRGRGWNYFFDLAKQATAGLQFVHKNGIVHRDVKPSNFLVRFIGDKTVVKIADVGLSRSVELNATTRIGTKIYSSPEVQLGSLHSFSSDIYSLLLVLFELWYGQMIQYRVPADPKLNYTPPPPQLLDTYPPRSLKDVMRSAWRRNPAERPSVGDIMHCLAELSKTYLY